MRAATIDRERRPPEAGSQASMYWPYGAGCFGGAGTPKLTFNFVLARVLPPGSEGYLYAL
jgi:hypothetical protein